MSAKLTCLYGDCSSDRHATDMNTAKIIRCHDEASGLRQFYEVRLVLGYNNV
jgi:hypothetical protein